MGPLKHLNSIRLESKHQICKAYATSGNNFINLSKTVTIRHQQYMAGVQNSYLDEVTHGKTKLVDVETKTYLIDCVPDYFQLSDELFEVSFLKLNSYDYRKGFLIIDNHCLCEIDKILYFEGKFYFLLKSMIRWTLIVLQIVSELNK